VIIVVCLIGAYTISNRMLDVYLALGFGVIGYLFKKLDYPIAPLILAMVLGDKMEDAFRQSMLLSQGSFSIFFSNGLVSTLMVLSILLACWGLIPRFGRRRAGGPSLVEE
jgi:TctA family transporter